MVMEIKRQKYLNEIADNLAWLKNKISLSNAIQLTDIDLFAEDLICGFLNILYDLKLENLNNIQPNYKGIDLGDRINRIAVQVTFSRKRIKVEKTIDDFLECHYEKYYDRLLIVVLGDRTKFNKDFNTRGIFKFSRTNDVLDINEMIREVNKKDDEKVEKIHSYLEKQFIKGHAQRSNYTLSKVEYVTDPPTNQCRFYQERTTEESDIQSWLMNGSRSYIIRGTGGIGKTELAKAIWHKMVVEGENYNISHLAWVPYQNSDLKLSICRAFLETKSIKNTDAAWIKNMDFFMKVQRNLLVFIDNIEKTEENDSVLRSLNQYPFRAIITTRQKLAIDANETELLILPEHKCKELFYKHYDFDRNDEALSEILKKAGYLTVVIELLAKTAMIEEMSLVQLNKKILQVGFNISEENVLGEHDLLTKEDKIAEQLKKLFSISSCSDQQIQLLIKISMFPAKELSYENVKSWFGERKRTPLISLVNKGWIREQTDSNKETRYWMHPVLAESIRLQTETILYHVCRPLIDNFTKMLIPETKDNIFERFSIISYANILETYQRKYFCCVEDLEFLKALGNVYVEMAEYGKAIDVYSHAYRIAKNMLHSYEKEIEFSNLLGSAYKQTGNFKKAMRYYGKVMNKLKSKKNVKAENFILAYRDMGHMYKSMGNYSEALVYYNLAEDKYNEEKKERPELSQKYLAMIYYGKGNLYRCAENYDISKDFYTKAKEIYKDIVNNTNFEWMLLHDNIGVCYLGMKNYKEAIKYHKKALDLQSSTYKEIKQPFMGLSYMYLGDVYMEIGETDEAYKNYINAEEIILNSVGDKHPYMIRVKNHIAKYFIIKKDYKNAEKVELEALSFENTELGKIHPDTAELYNNLTEIYCALHDEPMARFYHNKIKEYTQTVLHSHPETLKVWMREAMHYLKMSNYKKAKEQLKKLLDEASEITKDAPIVKLAESMLNDI